MITQDQILALSFPVIGAAVAVATGFLAMRIWVKPVQVPTFAASEDKSKDETEAALNKIVANLTSSTDYDPNTYMLTAVVLGVLAEDAEPNFGGDGRPGPRASVEIMTPSALAN